MLRLAVILALAATFAVAKPEYKHGVSFFGEFKYPPGFEHFDYVNPDAPKGGTLVLATDINWNSFTPYLDRGIETPGVSVISYPILYNGLFAMAPDELGTFYADLAEAVMVADDFTRVRVRMRPEARWHDGEPVTARDVAFTFDYIRNDSSPNIRSAFAMVASTEIHNDLELTFHLRNTTGAQCQCGDQPRQAGHPAGALLARARYHEDDASRHRSAAARIGLPRRSRGVISCSSGYPISGAGTSACIAVVTTSTTSATTSIATRRLRGKRFARAWSTSDRKRTRGTGTTGTTFQRVTKAGL